MIKSSQTGKTRQLLLAGEIDWNTLAEVYEHLVTPKPYEQIRLFISSQGGDRDAAISLLSFLKGLTVPITTVAIGKVYSAAVYPFFASRNRRFALPDAIFLFHATSFDMEGDVSIRTLEENVGADQLDSNYLANLLRGLSVPKKILNQMVNPKTSLFISAQLAEQYGLVTKVIQKFEDVIV